MLVLLVVCLVPGDARAQLLAGDRAWEARAELLDGRLADHDRIERAIRAYSVAAEAGPEALEARWKLLRALHYLVEFSNAGEQRKDEAVGLSVSLASAWIDALESADVRPADEAQLYFWSAICWGARGQRVGLLTIVREGVAGRMHEYALRAVALDPEIERGGGYRLLSRLHAGLPRVPFISGWVDRERVLPLAERAFAIDPDHPGNGLVLALALLARAPGHRSEAAALLERVSQREPRPASLAEDLAIREEARERLRALGGAEPAREQPG